MKTLIKTLLIVLLLNSACANKVFLSDLPEWLNIEEVEIENCQTYDVFGGFGDGFTLEVYTLSTKTIKMLQKKKPQKLPPKEEWHKINWKDWEQESSAFIADVSSILNINESKEMKKQLKHLQLLLTSKDSQIALYYKNSYIRLQLFLLSIKERKFYVYDFAV